MKVHWTDMAIGHLRSLHAYIGQSSPEYAQSVVDRLTRRSQQIGNFPQSGRIVPEAERPQIREVLEGSYRIMYHIKPDQVDVIAVIHGSQQTPWT
ncbi:MAG: type II toxin-antitoxin system RelE/ParE family toxin [Nitrospira sp.]|nr:MAG: type II toxin-antitoxin system RelE/ParE family toxin [Nitrospira sp.]